MSDAEREPEVLPETGHHPAEPEISDGEIPPERVTVGLIAEIPPGARTVRNTQRRVIE